MEMTSRERVLATIAHREPDRVPCNLRLVPNLMEMVKDRTGNENYAEYFGHDVRYVPEVLPSIPPMPDGVPPTEWTPQPTAADIAKLKEQTVSLQNRGFAVCGGYFMGVYEQSKDWIGDEATHGRALFRSEGIFRYVGPHRRVEMLALRRLCRGRNRHRLDRRRSWHTAFAGDESGAVPRSGIGRDINVSWTI